MTKLMFIYWSDAKWKFHIFRELLNLSFDLVRGTKLIFMVFYTFQILPAFSFKFSIVYRFSGVHFYSPHGGCFYARRIFMETLI